MDYTPVQIGQSKPGIEPDGLVVAFDSLCILAQPVIREAPIIMDVQILRDEGDGLFIVFDGPLMLAKPMMCQATVVIGLETLIAADSEALVVIL